jgi:hypothetical protein
MLYYVLRGKCGGARATIRVIELYDELCFALKVHAAEILPLTHFHFLHEAQAPLQ